MNSIVIQLPNHLSAAITLGPTELSYPVELESFANPTLQLADEILPKAFLKEVDHSTTFILKISDKAKDSNPFECEVKLSSSRTLGVLQSALFQTWVRSSLFPEYAAALVFNSIQQGIQASNALPPLNFYFPETPLHPEIELTYDPIDCSYTFCLGQAYLEVNPTQINVGTTAPHPNEKTDTRAIEGPFSGHPEVNVVRWVSGETKVATLSIFNRFLKALIQSLEASNKSHTLQLIESLQLIKKNCS